MFVCSISEIHFDRDSAYYRVALLRESVIIYIRSYVDPANRVIIIIAVI